MQGVGRRGFGIWLRVKGLGFGVWQADPAQANISVPAWRYAPLTRNIPISQVYINDFCSYPRLAHPDTIFTTTPFYPPQEISCIIEDRTQTIKPEPRYNPEGCVGV